MTWWLRASRASRRPISTAARPPTPASTSSNTSVGTGSEWARTTSIASITRDSSPPDAALCTGSGGAPSCARHAQLDLVDAVRARVHERVAAARRRRPAARAGRPARPTRADHQLDARLPHRQAGQLLGDRLAPARSAAFTRSDVSTCAPLGQLHRPARRAARSSSASASSDVSSPASRSAASARPRQHAVDVGGVLPGQPLQLGLPRQHLLQHGRVGVQRIEVAAQLGADVGQQRLRLGQPRRRGHAAADPPTTPAGAARRRPCRARPARPGRLPASR